MLLQFSEEEETVKASKGAISGDCEGDIDVSKLQFQTQAIFRDGWVKEDGPCARMIRGPVLAVARYEYANWYHVATDFVNAYLAAEIHELDPSEVSVLLLDGHATPIALLGLLCAACYVR